MKKTISITERFWSKVEKSKTCWVWIGAKNGSFIISKKKPMRAQRYSYLLDRGKINDELQVHSICRDVLCVNPLHLYQVGDQLTDLRCTACNLIKPISEFRRHKNRPTYNCECRGCTSEKKIKKNWNLSKDQFSLILDAQYGVCAICKTKTATNLCVDHDHTTGKIRGLLCQTCNKALGLFKDSIDNLKCAILYLEKSDDQVMISNTEHIVVAHSAPVGI